MKWVVKCGLPFRSASPVDLSSIIDRDDESTRTGTVYAQAAAECVFTPTVQFTLELREGIGEVAGARPEPTEVDLRLGEPRMSQIRKPSAIMSHGKAKPSEVRTHHHTHGDTQHHKQQNNVQHCVSAFCRARHSGCGHAAKRGRHRLTPCRGHGNLGTRQFSDILSHTAVSGRRDSHDLAPPSFAFFGFRPHHDFHHKSSFTDPRFVTRITNWGNVTHLRRVHAAPAAL